MENSYLILQDHNYCDNKKKRSLGGAGQHIHHRISVQSVLEKLESSLGVDAHLFLNDNNYNQSKKKDFVHTGGGLYGLDSSYGMHRKKGGRDKLQGRNGAGGLMNEWLVGQKVEV